MLTAFLVLVLLTHVLLYPFKILKVIFLRPRLKFVVKSPFYESVLTTSLLALFLRDWQVRNVSCLTQLVLGKPISSHQCLYVIHARKTMDGDRRRLR